MQRFEALARRLFAVPKEAAEAVRLNPQKRGRKKKPPA